MSDRAKNYLDFHGQLKSQRSTWDSWWQDLAEAVMPRKASITEKQGSPTGEKEARLYDSTAVRANMANARGHVAGATPKGTIWHRYKAPLAKQGIPSVVSWFNTCSEITLQHLSNSNFYSQFMEVCLDRSGFGTSNLFVERGSRNLLHFRAVNVGTFCIAENHEGFVDTVTREFTLTSIAAFSQFGDALHEKIRSYASGTPEQRTHPWTFVHLVRPRSGGGNPNTFNPLDMPFESVYIDKENIHIVDEGGYTRQPYCVSRYLEWSGDVAGPYGWCPAWVAYPEHQQLQHLQKMMDDLAEVSVFPRVLVPSTHDGEVGLGAGAYTKFDPFNRDAIPREWATAGRYDVGAERIRERQEIIEKAFHADMFKLIAERDKTMTAREIMELAEEKHQDFFPSFISLTTEQLSPVMAIVFEILFQNRAFPEPPPEVFDADGAGVYLPIPESDYLSKMAMAVQQSHNVGFTRTIEALAPLAQVNPDLLDVFDIDVMAREYSRNAGIPESWMRSDKMVQFIRQQRQQQMEQQQQLEQLQMGADALNKAGGPEGVQQIAGMAGGA